MWIHAFLLLVPAAALTIFPRRLGTPVVVLFNAELCAPLL
jgi:hypothetical protein